MPAGDRVVAQVDPDDAARYRREGWWGDRSLADVVAEHAVGRPDGLAVVSDHGHLTWRTYDRASARVAAALVRAGYEPGDRLAIWVPDSGSVHAALLGAEKAGVTAVGIGARAGERELRHIIERTGARGLATWARWRGSPSGEVVNRLRADGLDVEHVEIPVLEADLEAPICIDGAAVDTAPVDLSALGIAPDDLFLINSTSGTTGLPKCVLHHQNRWMYFHQKARENAALTSEDVFYGAVPAPYGFGIWTTHFTPTLLGAPVHVTERFDPGRAIELIEREQVTVLGCVSTQFIMMLKHPAMASANLSSLRVMFTGGEAIPYEQAARFEDRTGCAVLQFFGSNETGLLSGTDLASARDHRLRTAGRVVPEMQVRLYDDGRDVTASGRGQPAGRGPATCIGYLDPEANAELFTADGWMLMGDVCTLNDGYLSVVGRLSDFIIRGGKNISAVQVEEEVASHPQVRLAAAVAYPDEVFGERVCVFVEVDGEGGLTLDQLLAHLEQRGTSKDIRPERLEVLHQLPRSSGGKVAKSELRALARVAHDGG